MQKIIVLLLSAWMIFASSCALKNVVIQDLGATTTVEQAHHPLGISFQFSTGQESCTSCIEADDQKATLLSVADFNSAPDLSLLKATLFAFLFSWRWKNEEGGSNNSLFRLSSPLYKLPLYLQFRRLQFYA